MSALSETPTGRARGVGAAVLTAALLLTLSGCGARTSSGSRPPSTKAAGHGDVAVLYAGALVSLMEQHIGPAFDRTGGYRFQGYAGGSVALAHEIRGRVRRADIFISAAPSVNRGLMGRSNGSWLSWYIPFAQAPLVIAYNPHSRFAAQWKSRPWYRILAEPGFRLGRTDPKLDPKGALTIQFLHTAARYYHHPGLTRQLLGATENPAQVFAEETLVGRLQAGQLDGGFFYANEAVQARLPFVTPPGAIDPKAVFTVSIVRGAPDPRGARAFVRFLLGTRGQALLKQGGLTLVPLRAVPRQAALPSGIG